MTQAKSIVQADRIGGGWIATFYSDGSMMLSNAMKGLAHYLSRAERDRLREIMNEVEELKAVAS